MLRRRAVTVVVTARRAGGPWLASIGKGGIGKVYAFLTEERNRSCVAVSGMLLDCLSRFEYLWLLIIRTQLISTHGRWPGVDNRVGKQRKRGSFAFFGQELQARCKLLISRADEY